MTNITKAAMDAIEAFEAMTKGNERDSDGAWGRIVMPSNAALEKADKAADALRAALQDAPISATDDEVLALAVALETRRILEHIKVVAATQPIDEMPTPYQSAWHGACEEIFYRATGQQWHMDEDATRFDRAALQDKAEVRGDEAGRSGHYFQFERGEWAKNGDEPTKFWPASGLHYVGRITKDQRDGLDKLIRDYLDGAQPAPVVPDGCAIVPVEATEEQWGGLARDIMLAFDMNAKSPALLINTLTNLGHEIPQWLIDEVKDPASTHVLSKGTRAVIIYRAMISASQQKGGQ